MCLEEGGLTFDLSSIDSLPSDLKRADGMPSECFTACETLIQHAHALSSPFLTHTYRTVFISCVPTLAGVSLVPSIIETGGCIKRQ